MSNEDLIALLGRMDQRITELRDLMLAQRAVKDWYSTDEAAELLEKAAFTVREWCRHGRIRAEKRAYRRGKSAEWMISHTELIRVRNEGLLPLENGVHSSR